MARLGRQGCQHAVGYVNGEIADLLEGFDAEDQRAVDFAMIDLDGTPNKARLVRTRSSRCRWRWRRRRRWRADSRSSSTSAVLTHTSCPCR